MILSFEPLITEELPNSVSVDGYMEKEDLLGPFRKGGEIVYYDPSEGKFLNPKINSYRKNNAHLQF